jgi:hypothetical protein
MLEPSISFVSSVALDRVPRDYTALSYLNASLVHVWERLVLESAGLGNLWGRSQSRWGNRRPGELFEAADSCESFRPEWRVAASSMGLLLQKHFEHSAHIRGSLSNNASSCRSLLGLLFGLGFGLRFPSAQDTRILGDELKGSTSLGCETFSSMVIRFLPRYYLPTFISVLLP